MLIAHGDQEEEYEVGDTGSGRCCRVPIDKWKQMVFGDLPQLIQKGTWFFVPASPPLSLSFSSLILSIPLSLSVSSLPTLISRLISPSSEIFPAIYDLFILFYNFVWNLISIIFFLFFFDIFVSGIFLSTTPYHCCCRCVVVLCCAVCCRCGQFCLQSYFHPFFIIIYFYNCDRYNVTSAQRFIGYQIRYVFWIPKNCDIHLFLILLAPSLSFPSFSLSLSLSLPSLCYLPLSLSLLPLLSPSLPPAPACAVFVWWVVGCWEEWQQETIAFVHVVKTEAKNIRPNMAGKVGYQMLQILA